MSIVRTTEVTASSQKGVENAIENDGEVSEYRVTVKVTFILDD